MSEDGHVIQVNDPGLRACPQCHLIDDETPCRRCGWTDRPDPAALLLNRAESYQRDAGVIRQSGRHAEAVAYETIAAELRKVAEEVGRG